MKIPKQVQQSLDVASKAIEKSFYIACKPVKQAVHAVLKKINPYLCRKKGHDWVYYTNGRFVKVKGDEGTHVYVNVPSRYCRRKFCECFEQDVSWIPEVDEESTGRWIKSEEDE